MTLSSFRPPFTVHIDHAWYLYTKYTKNTMAVMYYIRILTHTYKPLHLCIDITCFCSYIKRPNAPTVTLSIDLLLCTRLHFIFMIIPSLFVDPLAPPQSPPSPAANKTQWAAYLALTTYPPQSLLLRVTSYVVVADGSVIYTQRGGVRLLMWARIRSARRQ